LSNIEKIEVLPYHTLGVYKWEKLGIKYSLAGINAPANEEIKKAEELLTEDGVRFFCLKDKLSISK
jgi:pyruvate formate lyase activating enzyme